MTDAARPLSYTNSDEKVPITPTEPPKAYDPHTVERSHPSPGEPITAVNSIILEEGLMTKGTQSPTTPPAKEEEEEEPEIPVAELPLVVRPFSAKMRKYLMNEVDTNIASFPLAAYCFMTGYVSRVDNTWRSGFVY
jgi:hypothetical protein